MWLGKKSMTSGVEGACAITSTALNQIVSPAGIAVPLKFDVIDELFDEADAEGRTRTSATSKPETRTEPILNLKIERRVKAGRDYYTYSILPSRIFFYHPISTATFALCSIGPTREGIVGDARYHDRIHPQEPKAHKNRVSLVQVSGQRT
jgi:hypothetical protein